MASIYHPMPFVHVGRRVRMKEWQYTPTPEAELLRVIPQSDLAHGHFVAVEGTGVILDQRWLTMHQVLVIMYQIEFDPDFKDNRPAHSRIVDERNAKEGLVLPPRKFTRMHTTTGSGLFNSNVPEYPLSEMVLFNADGSETRVEHYREPYSFENWIDDRQAEAGPLTIKRIV